MVAGLPAEPWLRAGMPPYGAVSHGERLDPLTHTCTRVRASSSFEQVKGTVRRYVARMLPGSLATGQDLGVYVISHSFAGITHKRTYPDSFMIT